IISDWREPDPPSIQRYWHAQITSMYRRQMVGTLVCHTVFSCFKENERVRDVFVAVRAIEKEAFNSAITVEEYHENFFRKYSEYRYSDYPCLIR
ncbi:hypothetical protein PFISCL1PPCAC_1633, partial [Pristionchus fissidentatus]